MVRTTLALMKGLLWVARGQSPDVRVWKCWRIHRMKRRSCSDWDCLAVLSSLEERSMPSSETMTVSSGWEVVTSYGGQWSEWEHVGIVQSRKKVQMEWTSSDPNWSHYLYMALKWSGLNTIPSIPGLSTLNLSPCRDFIHVCQKHSTCGW